MTIPGQSSLGNPPKNASINLAPARPAGRPRKPTTKYTEGGARRAPSGKSRPDSPFGTQTFFLTYRPLESPGRDIAFLGLSPTQQAIVVAIMEYAKKEGKTELSRAELAALLEATPGLQGLTLSPWDSFMRHLPTLVRLKLIARAPRPKSKKESKMMPVSYEKKAALVLAPAPPLRRGR